MSETIIVVLLFAILIICPLVFLFPLIKPKWYFKKGNKTRKDVLKYFGITEAILVVLFIVTLFTLPKEGEKTSMIQENLPQPTQGVIPVSNQNSDIQEVNNTAIELVASSLGKNKLDITKTDLKTKDNPKGEGMFVYVPQTKFFGVERYILWIVVDNQAYPLNGATKDITPDLPWLREVEDEIGDKTGLNKFQTTEAIDMVFKGD